MGRLTTDSTKNVVGIAATAALRAFDARKTDGRPPGVRLWLDKRMPLASGLGSRPPAASVARWRSASSSGACSTGTIRAPLVPGFADVKQTALAAGALGCSLSGSGPSVFAFASSDDQAAGLAACMAARFQEVAGLDSDTYVGRVNTRGARRVEEEE